MVVRDMPVALASSDTPPRGSDLASAAAHTRRPRSSRIRLRIRYFSRSTRSCPRSMPTAYTGRRTRSSYLCAVPHLHGMRSKLLGQLILDRPYRLDEAALVHVDQLDPHRLQFHPGVLLEFQGVGRLQLRHLVRRGFHPLLLLVREAVPRLLADPDEAVVRLVL